MITFIEGLKYKDRASEFQTNMHVEMVAHLASSSVCHLG